MRMTLKFLLEFFFDVGQCWRGGSGSASASLSNQSLVSRVVAPVETRQSRIFCCGAVLLFTIFSVVFCLAGLLNWNISRGWLDGVFFSLCE